MPVITACSRITPLQDLTELYHELGMEYPKFFKMDDLCRASLLGAELVLRKVGMADSAPKTDMALVMQNGSSSLDTDTKYLETISPENYFPSPATFSYTLANILTGEICIRYKIFGESSLYICEKFSPEDLVRAVNWALRDHTCTGCLCGWADCHYGVHDVMMMLASREGEGPDFSADTLNDLYK